MRKEILPSLFLSTKTSETNGGRMLPQLRQKWVCIAVYQLLQLLKYLTVVIKEKIMFNKVFGIGKGSECSSQKHKQNPQAHSEVWSWENVL